VSAQEPIVMTPVAGEGADRDLTWLRPHPLTMLVELVDAIKQTAVFLLFVLLQRGFSIDTVSDLVVIAAPLGLAGARYLSTRYAVTADAVHHRTGIVRKATAVMARTSIQSVTTQETLMARMTGTVELEIADAAALSDIRLRLLSREDADRLMAELGSSSLSVSVSESGPVGSSTGGRDAVVPARVADNSLIVRSSIGNGLSIGPLIATTVLSLALVVAVMMVGLDSIRQHLELIGVTVLPLFVLSVPARILTPLVRLMNFKLWSTEDHLRSEGGLFTRQQGSSLRERVQTVTVERHWFGRRLGVERVRFSTADFDGRSNSPSVFLDPGARLEDWKTLAPLAVGSLELDDTNLHRVSPLTRRRVMARFVLLAFLILIGGVALGLTMSPGIGWLAVAVAAATILIGDLYSRRRWERLGWALSDNQLLVRAGAVDERINVMRIEKVQSASVYQTLLQRRLGLATLRLGTAGPVHGDVTLPDLTDTDARALADHLLRHSASVPIARTI